MCKCLCMYIPTHMHAYQLYTAIADASLCAGMRIEEFSFCVSFRYIHTYIHTCIHSYTLKIDRWLLTNKQAFLAAAFRHCATVAHTGYRQRSLHTISSKPIVNAYATCAHVKVHTYI